MNEGICMLVDYSATMYHVGITKIASDTVNMEMDLSQSDSKGSTPLTWAAEHPVKLLLGQENINPALLDLLA